jgi:hypothetical protein
MFAHMPDALHTLEEHVTVNVTLALAAGCHR